MMDDKSDQNSDVKIYAPDTSLQKKIGVDINALFSDQVIAEAQTLITQSADQFWEGSLSLLKDLTKIAAQIKERPEVGLSLMPLMVNSSFMLRAEAGQAGYDLAATLAKSLQFQCQQKKERLASKDLNLIQWHVDSLGQILQGGVKGDGGEVGKVIMAELERLLATLPPGVRG